MVCDEIACYYCCHFFLFLLSATIDARTAVRGDTTGGISSTVNYRFFPLR
jgi:hypothetical protein